jgi:hypothetical protein
LNCCASFESPGKSRKAVRPVELVPGSDFDIAIDADLHPVAVEFDFMNPLGSHRDLLDENRLNNGDEVGDFPRLRAGG